MYGSYSRPELSVNVENVQASIPARVQEANISLYSGRDNLFFIIGQK